MFERLLSCSASECSSLAKTMRPQIRYARAGSGGCCRAGAPSKADSEAAGAATRLAAAGAAAADDAAAAGAGAVEAAGAPSEADGIAAGAATASAAAGAAAADSAAAAGAGAAEVAGAPPEADSVAGAATRVAASSDWASAAGCPRSYRSARRPAMSVTVLNATWQSCMSRLWYWRTVRGSPAIGKSNWTYNCLFTDLDSLAGTNVLTRYCDRPAFMTNSHCNRCDATFFLFLFPPPPPAAAAARVPMASQASPLKTL